MSTATTTPAADAAATPINDPIAWLVPQGETVNGENIVELFDADGNLGITVIGPSGPGYAVLSSTTTKNPSATAGFGWLTVDRTGSGPVEIVQITKNPTNGNLGMSLWMPAGNTYVHDWTDSDLGVKADDTLAIFAVEMLGDGVNQILQLWDHSGQLAYRVFTPDTAGGYEYQHGDDLEQRSGLLALLVVDADGDGKDEVVQFWPNGENLAYAMYSPGSGYTYSQSDFNATLGPTRTQIDFVTANLDGKGGADILQLVEAPSGNLGANVYTASDGKYSQSTALSTADLGIEPDAYAYYAVHMLGDSREQVIQLRDNGGNLGGAVIAPSATGGLSAIWKRGDMGEGAGAKAFLVVDANQDGYDDIAQIWPNGSNDLNMALYSPGYALSWAGGV